MISATNILIVGVIVIALVYLWYGKRGQGAGSGPAALTTYTRDLTEAARRGTIDPVVGREKEVARAIEILSRRSKNNPLLLGHPGVGKTAIAEGLAVRIIKDDVPDDLRGKKVLSLDLVGLISGTKYRGEFEGRIKSLLAEVISLHRQVILFIDEIHMLAQAKGGEGSLNVSDILKPALARGELQVIGATTPEEYETYIRPDETLDRRFQPIEILEPSVEQTLGILHGIKPVYEKYHQVKYTDGALRAAIELSAAFTKKRYLPDRAIDLMDEVGAHVKINASAATKNAAGLAYAAGESVSKRGGAPGASPPTVTEEDVRKIVEDWKD